MEVPHRKSTKVGHGGGLTILELNGPVTGSNIVPKTSDTLAADRAGIEKLRKADIDATLTQEPSALTTLRSEMV